MSARRIALGVALPLLAGAAALVAGNGAGAAGTPVLTQLRQATVKYHDVEAATADGFADLHLCFDMMGEHFANPTAPIDDGVLDALNPEALVYAHTPQGLRLVAVEWISTTPGTVPGVADLHDGPFGLHVLHAWIWQANPDGMHADMNPSIGDCPT